MKRFRSILFWVHLGFGVIASVVILIMSVTGVLLTYQRQITAWADMRGYHRTVLTPDLKRLSADALLAKAIESTPGTRPTAMVIRSDRTAPASVTVAPGKQLFLDPYSGAVLGEGKGQSVRSFFRAVVDWHQELAVSAERQTTGRALTGASNLMFLFLVLSGLWLWWPRVPTWAAFRQVTWFRKCASGKARDFNWHNTIGFWSAIPLAIIVVGGVVMSYSWATALLYRAYGEQPPAAQTPRSGGGQTPPPAFQGASASLESMVVTAEDRMAGWRTITIALPKPSARNVVLTLDAGDGGQPHKRATLTLDRHTGSVDKWEPSSTLSAARRARNWLRYAHTGEVYGLAGQTVAGVVTFGAVVLVWTGIALTLRRFLSWRKRASGVLSKAA
ncbi:MAG TPA: PepSY-associated TM helix domain-containing protein [Vicinamibacterales bacterium]|nr:PepSY-associated TM helix domain-containing protein [Vicinamibacterales bacterium]